MKAISKDPGERFQTASEFSQRLRSSKKEDFSLNIGMPDFSGSINSFGWFIKNNIKYFLLILIVATLYTMYKFSPSLSLAYLSLKEYFMRLYIEIFLT